MDLRTLELDERNDLHAMQDLINKDPLEVAKALTQRFTDKYGHEFRGFVKVSYEMPDDLFSLEIGLSIKETIDRGELLLIPERIRFYRELKMAENRKLD